MQIPPKIVLLSLVTVMIVEPPGSTVAKTTSKHGASSETNPEPRSSKTEAPFHPRTCSGSSSHLLTWLCHAAQATLPEFPGGNTALYIINKFLERSQDQNSPIANSQWDRLRDDVTQYLDDSLSPSSFRNIRGKLEGFRVAYQHCSASTTGSAKTSCLHNLLLIMLAAEGTFKGHTTREKSLLLKYFDRFTILFNAITHLFKTSYDTDPPVNGTIDIDRTIRSRQCSFYRYIGEAIPAAREYACRHIYLKFFDTTPVFWDRDLDYAVPPNTCNQINRSRKRREAFKDYHSVEITTVGSAKKHRGCGPLRRSRTYAAYVYNSKTEEYPWESRSIVACSWEAVGKLRSLCVRSYPVRERHVRDCKTNVRQNFEEGMSERRNEMMRLAGRNCA